MTDESKTLVAFLAAQSKQRPVRGYPRLAILAAPLAHDASLVVADQLTRAQRRGFADASRAELAGDHAKAAALLRDLVGNQAPVGLPGARHLDPQPPRAP